MPSKPEPMTVTDVFKTLERECARLDGKADAPEGTVTVSLSLTLARRMRDALAAVLERKIGGAHPLPDAPGFYLGIDKAGGVGVWSVERLSQTDQRLICFAATRSGPMVPELWGRRLDLELELVP